MITTTNPLGPDVWLNAPGSSNPIPELLAWLGEMRVQVDNWQDLVKANAIVWAGQISAVQIAIADAAAALPEHDVFPTRGGANLYDAACDLYQKLKDKLTLNSDLYLTAREQATGNTDDPERVAWWSDLFNKAGAFVRTFAIWILVVLVLVVVLKVVPAGGGKGFFTMFRRGATS